MWATGEPDEGYFSAGVKKEDKSRGTDCIDFPLNTPIYIAVTCLHENNHYKVTAYKKDLKSGKLSTFAIEKGGMALYDHFRLGGSCNRNFPIAEYDEVRMWNRALTQKELEVSIQKGPLRSCK